VPQQVGKAWVGAQAVEAGINFDDSQLFLFLSKSLLQPGEDALTLAQRRIDSGPLNRGNIARDLSNR
jgi:hypothetical protein